MRLRLNLKKGKTILKFRNPVKIYQGIKINSVNVIWSMYNVGINEKIAIDSTEHEVPTGYYTFDDLKEFLEDKNCVVKLEKSGKCTITPPSSKTLHLKNIGVLLGFNQNKSLNSKETSPYIIDIHGGIRNVEILCNKVNLHENYENDLQSDKLTNILVPSANLFGTTSRYNLDKKIPLNKGEITSIEFNVNDNSKLTDKNSYTLDVDCNLI